MIRDNLTNCTALVNALVESVEREEAIIKRLVSAVTQGPETAVIQAAHELARFRIGAATENCAE